MFIRVVLILSKVEQGSSYENRGTIVVLQRYVKALCFLDVF